MLVHRGTEAARVEGGRLLARACSQGDGLSCDRLGGFLAVGGKGFTKDEPRAVELLERACSLGAHACDEAKRLREKVGVSDLH
jgi:TPR repeat protein